MDERTLDRLEALANRLGVTVERLWETLLGDIVRRGIAMTVGGAVLLVLAVVAGLVAIRSARREKRDMLDTALGFPLVMLTALFGVGGSVLLGMGLDSILAPTANALKTVF